MGFKGLVTLLALMVSAAGCGEDASPKSGGDGANNFNNANNVNGLNNTNSINNENNEGAFTSEFTEIAGIMVDNCTQVVCHGSSSTTAFSVDSDQLADEGEVMAALEGVVAASSGTLLIDPGNAEGSEIYLRMNRERGDPLGMPQTGRLDQEVIDTVRNWIDDGAVYRR